MALGITLKAEVHFFVHSYDLEWCLQSLSRFNACPRNRHLGFLGCEYYWSCPVCFKFFFCNLSASMLSVASLLNGPKFLESWCPLTCWSLIICPHCFIRCLAANRRSACASFGSVTVDHCNCRRTDLPSHTNQNFVIAVFSGISVVTVSSIA